MPVAEGILGRFEIFRTLPENILERVCAAAAIESMPRRRLLHQPGDAAQGLGFLVDGRLQAVNLTLDGREAGLYFVEPGELFDELPAIDGQPHQDFLVAIVPSVVVSIPRQIVHEHVILQGGPLGATLMRALARRLRESMEQRALLSMPTPMQRVSAQIIRLARQTGGHRTINAPTHQEIAIMINTTRETVTRIFLLLQKKGAIRREGNDLEILNTDLLSSAAMGEAEP